MRNGIFFICLLLLGVAFLAFKDAATAKQEVSTDFQITHDQLQAAKAYIALFESGYYKPLFPFSKAKIAVRTYVYDIMQYLIFIGILLMLLERCREDEYSYVLGYTVLVAGDFADYILTHNDPYFRIGEWPISFNIVSVAFYTLFCTYIILTNESRRG